MKHKASKRLDGAPDEDGLDPLFFVIAIGSTGLGAHAITIVKASASGAGAPARPEPAKPQPAPTKPEQPPAPITDVPLASVPPANPPPATFVDGPNSPEPTVPRAIPVETGVAVPMTLTELYFPIKHPGVTRIETIGRILVPTAEDLKKVPADVDTSEMKLMLYRFHMTCCAADARPVFIILLGHDTKGLENETWAKITGRWVPAPGLGDMVKVVVDKLEIVPPPAEPYISDAPAGGRP